MARVTRLVESRLTFWTNASLLACSLLALLILAGCSDSSPTRPQDNPQPLAVLQPVGMIVADPKGDEAAGLLPTTSAPWPETPLLESLMPAIEPSPFWDFPQPEGSSLLSRLPEVLDPELADQTLVFLLPPQRIESLDILPPVAGDAAADPFPSIDELVEDLAEDEEAAQDVVHDAMPDLDFLVLLPPIESPLAEPLFEKPQKNSIVALDLGNRGRQPLPIFQESGSLTFPKSRPRQPLATSTNSSDDEPHTTMVETLGIQSGKSRAEGQKEVSCPQPSTSAQLATGVRTGAKVNAVAKEKIGRGYTLAERGASYAARQEFIQVLRMISRAKDTIHGAPRRTIALAQGLRALDEAKDFVAQGNQLEADLDVAIIVSSHRTPVGKEIMGKGNDSQDLLPQQFMEHYLRYAQVKLAGAVAGEPAGSMALHALGKLNSRQGKLDSESHPLAHRLAFVFQQAALIAHNENHLAAHELGVLLADSGHYADAEKLLLQVVQQEPKPIVYRNLARVQKSLGHLRQATASEQQANRVAQRSGSGNSPVQWVTPTQFSQSSNIAIQGLPMARRPQPMTAQLQFRK